MFKNKIFKAIISTAMAFMLAASPVCGHAGNIKVMAVEADANGFVIEDGVLKKYEGNEAVVTVPNTVTSIGSGAFSNCTGITSIVVPGTVTSIGERAFYGCSGLQSIELSEGIKSLGKWAFYGCSALESVVLPDGMESIGELAFYNCNNLTTIRIPLTVTEITASAISGNTSEDLIIQGKENSTAESFAKENNIEFISADNFEEENEEDNVVLPDGAKNPITGKCKIIALMQKSKTSARVYYQTYKGASGYQIHYSTNKNFKKDNKMTLSRRLYCTIYGLKKGRTYYVKVRAYKLDKKNKKIYLGKYSNVMSVKLKDKQTIKYGKDVYSFANPSIYHNLNKRGLYYKALIEKSSKSQQKTIQKQMEKKSGICFGMSCVMALSKAGKITPSFYYKNSLSEMMEPVSDTLVSYNLLNYYYLSQMVGKCSSARANYSKISEVKNNKKIVRAMEDSDYPVVIGFDIKETQNIAFGVKIKKHYGGHAVVGYDMKTEKDGYYISIWDPNHPDYPVQLFISADYKKSYFRNNYEWETGKYSTYLKYALKYEDSSKTYDEINIQKYIKDKKETSGRAISTSSVEDSQSNVIDEVHESVNLNTNYLDFKILTSTGSYVIVENGEKIEGDIEIGEAILLNGPGEELDVNFSLPVLKKGESYTVIPKDGQLSVVTDKPLEKYDTVLQNDEEDGYYASVSAKKPITLTVNTEGDIITKTENNEKVKQNITFCLNDDRISWLSTDIEGTDSEFHISSNQGKAKIISKDDTKVKVVVMEEQQELNLGEVVTNQESITVQADGEDYVAKNSAGIELLRKTMGYIVDFDTMSNIEVDALYNIQKNSLISEPQKIERKGYTFGGWYKSKDFYEEEKWDFAVDKVEGNITLYAKWIKNQKNQKITIAKPTKLTLKNTAKKTIKVTWKKVRGAKGYKVAYSTNKKFAKSKTKTITVKGNKASTVIKKLKKGKTYYVKVRAYKKDGTKTVYGKYSVVKKVRIKK